MKNKWRLSRINDGFKMTRTLPKENCIEYRDLKWYEKLRYYFKIQNNRNPTLRGEKSGTIENKC